MRIILGMDVCIAMRAAHGANRERWLATGRGARKIWGAVSMVLRQDGHRSDSALPIRFMWHSCVGKRLRVHLVINRSWVYSRVLSALAWASQSNEWKIQSFQPFFDMLCCFRAGLLAAWRRRRARFRVMVTPAMAMEAFEAGIKGTSLDGSDQLSS